MNTKSFKILAINNVDNGSTGNIACSILSEAKNNGFDVVLACVSPKRNDVPTYNISSGFINKVANHIKARLFDCDGFCSNKNTRKIINYIKHEKPNIVHLHNIHDYYLNIENLLSFLKKINIKVVWTFHDCWPFTGKCPNFIHNNCYKWKSNCSECPAKHEYPKSYFLSKSGKHFATKTDIFQGFNNLTIVCPSNWMQEQVKMSIAGECDTITIYNGIHDDFFTKENILTNSEVNNIISVAYPWTPYKRLDVIEKTAKSLEKNKKIRFIVVGIKKSKKSKNILYYKKLERERLIELYDESSILFNPSIEESFGLTNVEAQSRGVPVIIAKNSGGSEETILEGVTGISLSIDKLDFSNEILHFLGKINETNKKACIENAKHFSNKKMVRSYVDLFKRLLGTKE